LNSASESIWDTFWTIAAAISGLGLPGAVVLLLICYFVAFLRWICRDSSLAESMRATKPGRRLWLKMTIGTGLALFLLNLPLCSLELLRYGFLVASVACLISVFSKSLRDASRLAHWPFWMLSCSFVCVFDLLVWVYCRSASDASGLESFFPFIELLLVGLGCFLYFRLPESRKENLPSVSLRIGLCMVTLLVMEHSSLQMSYFLTYRYGDAPKADNFVAESSYLPVSSALKGLVKRSPPRTPVPPNEEKVLRARVEFEEDVARVFAFFLGLAGINAIVAVSSRKFGLREAKSIPSLVSLAPADATMRVPEMPEPVRRSVFFPDRAYRRGHRASLFFFAILGNLFVSSITTFSTSKGDVWHFLLSFVMYSGLLFPPVILGCRNGFRLAAYRARSSLHGVKILMHNPAYHPVEVTVRPPTLLQLLQNRITGAWVRHAVDSEGHFYSLMFGHCPRGEFPAQLYQLRSGPLNESLTGRQAYVAIPNYEKPLRVA